MKQLFPVAIALLLGAYQAQAQMDDKFYYPGGKWKSFDSIPHEDFTHVFEKDTVTSYLLKPAGKPRATVFYFHGAGGNVSSYVQYVLPLLKENIQVYMVDFRGYGHSTGKPTHLNIASDGQQLFDFARKLRDVKNTPIILMGVSMGTQIAAHLARNNEAHICGLVLDGCISSFTEIAMATSPPDQREMIRQYVPSPYSAKDDVAALKTTPVLFVYSFEDSGVPVAETEKVIAACTAPKTLYVFKGDHLMAPIAEEENYRKHIRDLLDRQLNAKEQK